MGGREGGASWDFKRAAKKIFVQTCGSLCYGQQQSNAVRTSAENREGNISCKRISSEITGKSDASTTSNKNLCSICLDPLNYSSDQAIFTAQCSHAFHFSCISSNVRHGSVTCPICRARWTQLPRNLNASWSIQDNQTDPVLQILDEYIANSREHRRSFLLQSSHYDDVDPVYPDHTSDQPRLEIISTPSYSGLLLAPNS
ncbi:E3 ubiquitin-protein ligase WAV3-like [Primulina tabacum]|uniref:E3 ubiquitin-protein ligase WAV3-like n=1 Tax=Primulina tabacum TaxID=48773 RepID=UPI003F59AE9B